MLDEQIEFVSYDEEANALDYLNKLHFFITNSRTDKSYWKWSILAMHAVLYAFTVISLTHTDGRFFITKAKNKNAKKKPLSDTDRDEVHLINLLEAIDYCQDTSKTNFLGNEQIILSENELKSIKQINYIRNEFQHYIPKLWDIEIKFLRKLLFDGLGICKKIIDANKNPTQLSIENKRQAESLIEKSLRECDS